MDRTAGFAARPAKVRQAPRSLSGDTAARGEAGTGGGTRKVGTASASYILHPSWQATSGAQGWYWNRGQPLAHVGDAGAGSRGTAGPIFFRARSGGIGLCNNEANNNARAMPGVVVFWAPTTGKGRNRGDPDFPTGRRHGRFEHLYPGYVIKRRNRSTSASLNGAHGTRKGSALVTDRPSAEVRLPWQRRRRRARLRRAGRSSRHW